MGFLIVRNVLEVGVVIPVKAGCVEIGLGEFVKSLLVEDVLKMLQGQSKLKDVSIGDGSLAPGQGSGDSGRSQGERREELHNGLEGGEEYLRYSKARQKFNQVELEVDTGQARRLG